QTGSRMELLCISVSLGRTGSKSAKGRFEIGFESQSLRRRCGGQGARPHGRALVGNEGYINVIRTEGGVRRPPGPFCSHRRRIGVESKNEPDIIVTAAFDPGGADSKIEVLLTTRTPALPLPRAGFIGPARLVPPRRETADKG